MTLTPKQKSLIKTWASGGLKRINILDGSVRSGKIYISIILWILFVLTFDENASFLMTARTLTALKRNVLELMEDLTGGAFKYSMSKKEGTLLGRRIYFEGSSDARSESKIRGLTLSGAYMDEATLCENDFFAMILSRLSVKGAKLIATTNPDSPHHWLMEKYISKKDELDLLHLTFSIDDNTFLPEEYVTSLKKEYTGVFYERYILGRWAVAEGLVYPMFNENIHVADTSGVDGEWYISIDYGTANPCSMGLWCIDSGVAYRVDEYYHSGRDTGKLLTDEEYYGALCSLAGDRNIQHVVIDPSALSFIETVRRHGRFTVKKAKNDCLNGIRFVASKLSDNRIVIDKKCIDAIKEFRTYAWDEDCPEDRPIKENDHAMDDIRYFCYTILRRCI